MVMIFYNIFGRCFFPVLIASLCVSVLTICWIINCITLLLFYRCQKAHWFVHFVPAFAWAFFISIVMIICVKKYTCAYQSRVYPVRTKRSFATGINQSVCVYAYDAHDECSRDGTKWRNQQSAQAYGVAFVESALDITSILIRYIHTDAQVNLITVRIN